MKITGETDDLLGLSVIDNNGVEHVVDIRKSNGEITAHNQDGYPDNTANRTPENNEHVLQARRYAQWHVYEERGYDTLRWDENLPRIKAVGEAIEGLSPDEFEEYFGAFYEAVAESLDTDGSNRLAGLISSVQGANAHYIDVWLDETDSIEKTGEVQPIIPSNEGYEDDLESPPEDAERVPDARIDLQPVPLPSIELFQQLVVHQTRCQVRDFWISMGEEPPEEYRVLGFGKYKFAARYQMDGRYEYDYTQLHADIPGYTVGLGLEDHPEIETGVKEFLSLFDT
ncbi:hypothetical protein [Halobiforma nitratireducens]|uniref:hypothetical protein n=1 Tax=Halobiforma nitratireducens TaxID=130048 RepID=UPI00195546AB|nr:hypothetical protein [Halobiforma nitratireducens]